MRTLRDQTPVIQDEDPVGVANRRQPVRDHQGRVTRAQPPERIEHRLFGDGIDGRSGFIENQDRGLLQQRAGDTQSLPFSPRQGGAPLGDRGVIALRKPSHEHVHVRGTRRRLHLGVGGVESAVSNVVGDGTAEEHRGLRDQCDSIA